MRERVSFRQGAQVMGILHLIAIIFFQALIICLLIRMVISWIPVGQDNPIVRFFDNITGPLIEPIVKRLPRVTFRMFDITYTIAFIFVWWALAELLGLVLIALPAGW